MIGKLPVVAVLGNGSIGTKHLYILKELGITAIPIPIRLEKVPLLKAEGWDAVTSLAEAVNKGAKAAIIATETGRHIQDVMTAITLGLTVLCEKPLALSAKDVDELVRHASKIHQEVYVAQCLRFDTGLQLFKSRLSELGFIHSVRIECRSYLPDWRPQQDYRTSYSADGKQGGVLRDLIHEIDYAVMLFGKPTVISGTLATTGQLGIASEELAEARWQTTKGLILSVSLDYLSRRPVRFVRASGSQGELIYDFIKRQLRWVDIHGHDETTEVVGRSQDMYQSQMKEFLEIIDGAPHKKLATLREGIFALSVCDAWRRSSLSGQLEEVIN